MRQTTRTVSLITVDASREVKRVKTDPYSGRYALGTTPESLEKPEWSWDNTEHGVISESCTLGNSTNTQKGTTMFNLKTWHGTYQIVTDFQNSLIVIDSSINSQ